ncbi:SDR family oxidoreductase [Gordonia sputi]|uniref:SDR family oxidoreductase n=1 Tax=Gordonia sputi TaxID=36823 RepID=UPI002042D184|nr:SDR family oxidoreductase [Gordonia sputi]MCM3893958.1 SDR family oxidoreductase [Gordonia sputi]
MPTTLIIGGSSGIGLATAARLSTLGDIVHIAGRNVTSLSEARRQHPSLISHELDARDFDAVASLAAEVGVVDRLIVTVSGNKGVGPLADLDLECLRSAFDEKLWPTITALKAALPHLAHSASVTLVGAITARIGMPETAGIGSLNAAVEGLVAPLAAELAPVRVNAVSPGYVDTPWWSMLDDEARPAVFKQIADGLPTKRIAAADDIAQVIELLATNPNITGTVIESDGGARVA